jgi:hypothetical protein
MVHIFICLIIIIESGTIGLTDSMWAKARYRAEVISSIAEEKTVSKVIATAVEKKLLIVKL